MARGRGAVGERPRWKCIGEEGVARRWKVWGSQARLGDARISCTDATSKEGENTRGACMQKLMLVKQWPERVRTPLLFF